MKLLINLLCLCSLWLTINGFIVKRSAQNEYKICVSENLLKDCEEMVSQKTKSTVKITCLPARDRIECIKKIKKHEADFSPVDPEDMYVAGKIDEQNEFRLFEEIRTKEEPDAEFRYEGVALVRKDFEVTPGELGKALKGLRSCHTGVGRNVGYKVPITKLKNLGIIGKLNDPGMSPRENELAAFASLFSKACIVGKWAPDPSLDRKLKTKYSNLCEMCEHPEKCDYPDNYSGYEGAIRCLVHNDGQIAWTKVIYVRKFFGLPVGTTPGRETQENADDYSYLCPDGSKVPLRSGAVCSWAARPWQAYVTHSGVLKDVDLLRRKIEQLDVQGDAAHAPWRKNVLDLTENNVVRESKVTPVKEHLDKANYTDVIERDYGPPFKTVRFCVESDEELQKCRVLSDAAFSRNVRPRFDCVFEKECFQTIRDNAADLKTLKPEELKSAQDNDLKPILVESYSSKSYAVVVVKKSSGFVDLRDLKGLRSCHTTVRYAGYYLPSSVLIKKGLLKKPPGACDSALDALAEHFSGGSCMSGSGKQKMCSLCPDKCQEDGPYSHCSGALKCLEEFGDVAFVQSGSLKDLDGEKYQLLCPDGGNAPVSAPETCNLGEIPANVVVTSASKTEEDIDELQHAVLAAKDLYKSRPDWFKLFGGKYGTKTNLLFSDKTVDLKIFPKEYSTKKIVDTLVQVDQFCH